MTKQDMDYWEQRYRYKGWKNFQLFIKYKWRGKVLNLFINKFNLLAKSAMNSMKNMILDNVRIHYAKLLKPFLDENKDRLKLMFLPAYSPELNLIEGVMGWLKSSIISLVKHLKLNWFTYVKVIIYEYEELIKSLMRGR